MCVITDVSFTLCPSVGLCINHQASVSQAESCTILWLGRGVGIPLALMTSQQGLMAWCVGTSMRFPTVEQV